MLELWGRVRPFIEHHFAMFLLGAFAIGLFVPDLTWIPKAFLPAILAAIIFFSCSKIKLDDFKKFRARDVAGFVVLRFLLLPVVVFYAASIFAPEYRFALLMLGLLPCGVTLAALMSILGGSAGLGLTATTLTSLIAPLSIPIAFSVLSGLSVDVDVWGMFQTLAFMIFTPVILYFGFVRRIEKVKLAMRRNSSAFSCLLICTNIIIVISYQQDKFFENFGFLFFTFLVGCAAYAAYYVLGWFFMARGNITQKISFALMSGNNNINLGISLAVLFMPPFESLVLIIWEINWILGLVLFQGYIRKQESDIV